MRGNYYTRRKRRYDERSFSAQELHNVRTSMYGYVGKKFAKKASDSDLIAMIELKDEKSRMYNQYISPIERQIEALYKSYRIKYKDGREA